MKATCSNCEHTFSVPAEFAGKVLKCPQCKKLVNVPKSWSNSRFLLIAIISAALVGVIGYGLGSVLNRPSKQETLETSAEITRLRDEIEQLGTQTRQLQRELQEAWAARQKANLEKTKEQERKKARVDWRKLGFDNFARRVPPKGKVKRLDEPVLGTYGALVGPLTRVMQVVGDDEVIVTAPFLDTTRGTQLNQAQTDSLLNRILEKGFAYTATLSTLEREILHLNPSLDYKPTLLKGFPTRGMVDNELWWSKGQARGNPEIAIISTYTYITASGGTNTVPLAIPLDFMRKGLTVGEFEQLLK